MSKRAAAILSDDMKRLIREQRLGHVATVCPDGTPNLSPKGTTMVWDDGTLIFADLRSPRTVKNLEHNSAIEVNVIDPVVRKGYRFKGRAKVVRDGRAFEVALDFFEREARLVRARVKSVVFVSVLRALPLTSPAYDTGRTEDSVASQWIRHYVELWEAGDSLKDGHGKEPSDPRDY